VFVFCYIIVDKRIILYNNYVTYFMLNNFKTFVAVALELET